MIPSQPIVYDAYPSYYYPTAPYWAALTTGAAFAAVVDWDNWGTWGGDLDIDVNLGDRANIDFNKIDLDKIDVNKLKNLDLRNIDRSKLDLNNANIDRASSSRTCRARILTILRGAAGKTSPREARSIARSALGI